MAVGKCSRGTPHLQILKGTLTGTLLQNPLVTLLGGAGDSSKSSISGAIIGVTPFRVLITLLITYLLAPAPPPSRESFKTNPGDEGSPVPGRRNLLLASVRGPGGRSGFCFGRFPTPKKHWRAKERERASERERESEREGGREREREPEREPDKPRVRARHCPRCRVCLRLLHLCLLYDASLLELRVGLASCT